MQDLNPFSTPQDPYATAQAQAAQRDYAKALLYGDKAKGGGQFPVVQSWSQGVSNMVNALMGGLALGDSQKRDQSSINKTAQPPGSPQAAALPPPDPPSFSEGPSSEGQEKSDGGLDRQANAIASVESKGSGDYSAVGPQTHTGDRAYGKYQVMGANVPKWTQEVLGKPMSPEEFLKNPQAQDTVFRTKFAQGGDNDTDRASVWFTGKPYAQGASRSDGYINGAQYVDRFNKAMGSPGQATAFAGPDASNSNPAVSAISSALRGGTQVAANVGGKPAGGGPLPQPNGQGIFVDPKLVPQRPPISEGQMRAIMNSPVLDPAAKAATLEQYRQQGQPVEVPYPGGKVVIDPHNPTRQQFIPDLQKSTTKLGDMEKSTYGTIGPSGTAPGAQFNPINPAPVPVAPPGPRSEAAPPVAPAANPPPAAPTAAPGAPNINVGAATPPASQAAPEAVAKPVQVASADPAQAFAAAAASGANPAATPPATPATPLTKLSANDEALKQFIGPEMWDAYTQKKAYEQGQALDLKKAESKIEVDKDAQTKSADFATKKYDTLSTAAQAARKQMPNLDLALAMMNDPNMHNGMLSGAQDIWSRFKAAALGEPYANAPNEAFDKIMASTVLGGIKDVGGGQIRNAEIQLLGKANANRTNTDASNRAVLEVSRRALQTTDHLDQIGQAYASGDAVVDPVTGKEMLPANIKNGEIEPRHGLDVGYDKLARKFVVEHPSFTPEEIKNYSAIFDSGRDGTATPQKAEGGKADKEAAPAVGAEKQFKQGVGVWDGQNWVPKK